MSVQEQMVDLKSLGKIDQEVGPYALSKRLRMKIGPEIGNDLPPIDDYTVMQSRAITTAVDAVFGAAMEFGAEPEKAADLALETWKTLANLAIEGCE